MLFPLWHIKMPFCKKKTQKTPLNLVERTDLQDRSDHLGFLDFEGRVGKVLMTFRFGYPTSGCIQIDISNRNLWNSMLSNTDDMIKREWGGKKYGTTASPTWQLYYNKYYKFSTKHVGIVTRDNSNCSLKTYCIWTKFDIKSMAKPKHFWSKLINFVLQLHYLVIINIVWC